MYFVAIESLERAKRTSQYRVFRLMTIAIQKKRKGRTVAQMEAISCS